MLLTLDGKQIPEKWIEYPYVRIPYTELTPNPDYVPKFTKKGAELPNGNYYVPEARRFPTAEARDFDDLPWQPVELHHFRKKTQKTPAREIARAKNVTPSVNNTPSSIVISQGYSL